MVKGSSPGIYSATYSGIPVYEYQFGADLKEHVMRRRHDDWINATHILKAAGFDKPARTRILERDVQKDVHEKIQGGYGKYQGTWIPLESAENLAQRHSVYDSLRPIFEYQPGNESPPPAPRHASKPKAPRASRPPIPKFNSKRPKKTATTASSDLSGTPAIDEYANDDSMMAEDDTPDNLTNASASYMAEDDRFDMSHASHTGHRKRKREEEIRDMTEQQHSLYGDELLDYFLLSHNAQPTVKPDPPANFQPNWPIDEENHTALHWASAMGDLEVIKQLKRFNANVLARNIRGETPFMRALNFTNCFDKQTFAPIMKELFEAVDARDNQGCTAIHHAAIMMKMEHINWHNCSRYYLENILNRLQETLEPDAFQQLLDVQNNEGNTALHLAAQRNARKSIRSLLGRNASADVPNNEGVRAEDLIMELNANKKEKARSSSPFAPDSHRHASFRDAFGDKHKKPSATFLSAAATTVQSRILPLITDKFGDLSKSYDEEWQQKDVAENEARRILNNNTVELNLVKQQNAELEAQLEAEDAAAKMMNEANYAKHQVAELLAHQNRMHIQQTVDAELNKVNGDASSQDVSPEEKLRLARALADLMSQQRQTETEYIDALSMVGTGDKIEKYRKLLKMCLDNKEGESLDNNLDSLIDMMEEQREAHDMDGLPDGEPMDVHV